MARRRSVLVTGASAGIGHALVLRLDKMGFRVFGTVRRPPDAEALERATGGNVRPVLMDITVPETVAAAKLEVAACVETDGLHALVNNAGAIYGGPAEFQDLDVVRQQLEINLIGHIAVTQAFLPLLRMGRGRIINVGSGHRFAPAPFVAAYCASKSGLGAFSDALRMELMQWGISVVMVDPGATDTPMWDKSLPRTEAHFQQLPAEAQALYHDAFYRTGRFFERLRRHGTSPERAARVIARAVAARRPRRLYLSGTDTLVGYLGYTFLPRSLYHRLLARLAGVGQATGVGPGAGPTGRTR